MEAGFDLVLADLGVSSMQIDNPARGFTWKAEGPLDLRLNRQGLLKSLHDAMNRVADLSRLAS